MLVETNLVPWECENVKQNVFLYAFYLNTNIKNTECIKKQIFDLMLSSKMDFGFRNRSVIGSKLAISFDGTFIYVNSKLSKKVTVLSVEVDNALVEFRLMFRGRRKLFQCHSLLKWLLFDTVEKLGYVKVHRKYVDPNACQDVVGSDLCVNGAYKLRLSLAEGVFGILVDVTTCLQRKSAVSNILEKNAFNIERIMKYLYGKMVTEPNKNDVYRIQDNYSENGTWKLILSAKGKTSNVDASNYRLIVSRRGDDVKVASELQDIIQLQDVINISRVSSNLRYACIQDFLKKLRGLNAELQKWGISFGVKTKSVTAKELTAPSIIFGRGLKECAQSIFWCNKTGVSKPFYKCSHCSFWKFYCLPEHAKMAQQLVDALVHSAPKYGFKLPKVRVRCVPQIMPADQERCRFVSFMRRDIGAADGVDLIVVLMPSPTLRKSYDGLYQRVKKFCMTRHAIASQMIRFSTLQNRIKDEKFWNAFISSLLNGINCKLGGSPWKVEMSLIPESTMVIGMDVWHDAESRRNSVGAICFSMDESMSEIFSAAGFHGYHDEVFKYEALRINTITALRKYEQRNNVLPTRLLVYRDGLNCRQYNQIRQAEVEALLAAIASIYRVKKPSITVVVVHKRIYERFFVKTVDGMENIAPGTVIDTEVTRRCGRGEDNKRGSNFFLMSKFRTRGTAVPTHYEVLYDNCEFPIDQLEQTTYELCHGYFNWPGVYYVPCMIQYAHKMASSVAKTGIIPPSAQLISSRLHFL